MAPTPPYYTRYIYTVEETANENQVKVLYSGNIRYSILDKPDNPDDDLSVLTDNDTFKIDGDFYNGDFIYLGKTANGTGIFAREIKYDPINGPIYIFSNKPVADNTIIDIKAEPYLVCYVAGTLIRTVAGEVPVETLDIGDLVVTASGAHRPVRWIGNRTLDCRTHPKPVSVLPVRIGMNALGPNRPTRDLLVSPRHAICLDLLGEVLVPADKLVNGATIIQDRVDTVTYWHVELDSHDLLVAEGVAAESYLDLGNRGFFAGAGTVPDDAVPGAPRTRADGCRPFVESGELITFARKRLNERARVLGWKLRPDPVAALHLTADGRTFEPVVEGTSVRFLLPAGCGEARLVSRSTVPALVSDGGERRRLGVNLRRLVIGDGSDAVREIALDDARLRDGFHAPEGPATGRHRWTRGDARLPASLWAERREAFVLRLELGGESLLRWQAPVGETAIPHPRASATAGPCNDGAEETGKVIELHLHRRSV